MEIIAKKIYLKAGTNESSYEKLVHIRSSMESRRKEKLVLSELGPPK